MNQAAVEAERHDVAGEMRRLAWTDIGEARQQDRADDVEVADDRRRPAAQGGGYAGELAAIEELAVREMYVGKGDLAHLDKLRPPARQPAWQPRSRQGERAWRPEMVRAPYREAVDAAEPGQAVEVAAEQGRQDLHVLGGFLHQQHIRFLAFRQGGDILDGRAGEPQQVPADDLQRCLMTLPSGRAGLGGFAR